MSDTPTLRAAFEQGYDAFTQGVEQEENPFFHESPIGQAWNDGYLTAERHLLEYDRERSKYNSNNE